MVAIARQVANSYVGLRERSCTRGWFWLLAASLASTNDTVDLREDLLMNATLKTRVYKQPRTELRLCDEPKAEEQAAFWRINGYRARLVIWTRDQWERMERPPADAQFHPTGVWCALRVD
jgi:hypothetical protein